MGLLHGEATRLRALTRPLTVRAYFQKHEEYKLNIGSGPHRHPGWLCADAFKSEADIYMQATKRFPFADNAFHVVYSEHMLEHIHTDYVRGFLSEVCRILKPGGVFRVTTPDLEIHAKHYIAKDDEFFRPIVEKYMKRWDKQKDKYWLVRSNGGAFMTRAVQRFYRHRWMYDFDTLASCLKEVGFSQCIKQSVGSSVHAGAGKLDRPDRAFETLYVDAVK